MSGVRRLGVVGAGTMGGGIAQLGCLAGYEVALHDPDPHALATGVDRLQSGLAKGAGKGLWTVGEAAKAAGKLEKATLADLAGCDLVVEAAPEDLELKRGVFGELARICGDEAVLATNTSSIPVSAIAADVPVPGRVCGMHFFNPPVLMRLVEVVAGDATDPEAVETVSGVARAMGREPVRAADAPGFIVNRCNRPYTLEALEILGQGLAGHAEIDRAMREVGRYRMGPFELMDLIGVDVNLSVARSFYAQRAEARWRPHPIQERMAEEGRLGRKAGRGFYEYRAGRRVEPAGAPHASGADPEQIFERIVSQLVNEASHAVEEGVATEPDVDTAMRLGLNHPRGPFEWRDELGAGLVVETLDRLAEPGAEAAERYRVADSLRGTASG